MIVDWGQTRYIAQHPDAYKETNPHIGLHPSTKRVNAYFAGYTAGTLLLANWLGPTNRKLLLGGMAIYELQLIGRNYSIGVGTSF
jgi:hypothetical protein